MSYDSSDEREWVDKTVTWLERDIKNHLQKPYMIFEQILKVYNSIKDTIL